MENNFEEYVALQDAVQMYGSFIVENYFNWIKDFKLPNLSLDLPSIEKKQKIELIIKNRNPILIQLADNSRLFFTHDEFKRIKGEPEVGKILLVKFLRLPNDCSESPSQIQYCQCL